MTGTTNSPTKPQACASCSRLASRVEELDGELDTIQRLLGKEELPTVLSNRDDLRERVSELEKSLRAIAERSRYDLLSPWKALGDIEQLAMDVLAGAHAEEKP